MPQVFKCASTVDQFKQKKLFFALMLLPTFISMSKPKKRQWVWYLNWTNSVCQRSNQNKSYDQWMTGMYATNQEYFTFTATLKMSLVLVLFVFIKVQHISLVIISTFSTCIHCVLFIIFVSCAYMTFLVLLFFLGVNELAFMLYLLFFVVFLFLVCGLFWPWSEPAVWVLSSCKVYIGFVIVLCWCYCLCNT